MIRDNMKIYGEPNDPNTITARPADSNNSDLKNNQIVVGDNNKRIMTNANQIALYIIGADGTFSWLPHQSNSAIGTDANGNIVWIPRSAL